VALIVSGGHTELVLCKNHGNYRILGGTRDDAAGEAFDKVARFLGLGYPGGPVIEKVAAGVKTKIKFPVPDAGRYDFSFSGLKTAAAFQAAAVETLVRKTLSVLRDKKINTLLVGGGVAANKLLRETLEKLSREIKFDLFLPEITFCTDNAAMIAAAAYYRKKYVKKFLLLEVQPNLKIA
jgi:N6-L-threonylcarbamoyladenine synthase